MTSIHLTSASTPYESAGNLSHLQQQQKPTTVPGHRNSYEHV